MFGRFLKKRSSRALLNISIGIILVIIILATFIYWRNVGSLGRGQILVTQQGSLVLARAGALAITEFFNSRKVELLVLTESPNMVSLADKEAARRQLEALVDGLSREPVADIVRVDKDGKLVFVVNKERDNTGEGVDLSDREYFRWAKNPDNKGKFFIGETITPRGGAHRQEQVFNIATPIYSGQKFNGVILFGVLASNFAEKYIFPLRLYEKTQAFLITDKGILIEEEPKELLGKNLIDYATENKWQGWQGFIEVIARASRDEGTGEFFFMTPDKKKTIREIVAYAPVKVDGARLGVIITNPWEVSQTILEEFSQNQTLELLLLFFSLPIVGLLLVISWHLTRRDAFLQGVNDGYSRGLTDGVKKT